MLIHTRPLGRLSILALVVLLLDAGAAAAQRRGGARDSGPVRGAGAESLDITAAYGHMWGGSVGTSRGTLRLDTDASWFFALDIPVDTATWLELAYTRQDTRLNLDRRGGRTSLSDMSVNYWHVGGVRGLPRGNVIPYVSGSLGVTYYSPAESRVTVDGDTFGLDSATKFSLGLGLGAKVFLGEARRFGLRAQFRTLATFYGGSSGIWFGTGGAGVSFSGSAVWQWEVSGGVTVRLGA
jgi:hypothetical protein